MRIGIDIDDTITNTIETMDNYASIYDSSITIRKDKYRIPDRYNWDQYKCEDFLKNYMEQIISNVSLKEDAVKYINKLHDEGNTIYFITARSDKYSPNVPNITLDYLKNIGIKYDSIITHSRFKDKECIDNNIDIMIDDSPRHAIECVKAGINFIIMDNDYNKDIDALRGHNWEEIYEIIKRS
ncbi:MAG: hypothetical protein IJ565_03455 [Bacilli bacterium]|nr:hypothetical protein [Bacilli bacterium]